MLRGEVINVMVMGEDCNAQQCERIVVDPEGAGGLRASATGAG